jgi:hypothetical protein
MSGIGDYDPPPILRSLDAAKSCLHLGPTLTAEEVKQYETELLRGGIPCRQCNGEIPAQHCRHPEVGPFTRPARCVTCRAWQAASPAASPRSA